MALEFAECLSMKAECATFWAGWGAIATAAVGVVTVVVALLAWLTSRRAATIAQQATTIAKQQHEEAMRLRNEDARIIGRMLLYEIDAAPHRLSALATKWQKCIAWDDDARIRFVNEFKEVLADAALPVFPGAEKVEQRIHNLPNALGADLATLIGGSRTLVEIVRKIGQRIHHPSHVGDRFRYQGSRTDLATLLHQLNWLATMSEALAAEFRIFVGVSEVEMKAARAAVENA